MDKLARHLSQKNQLDKRISITFGTNEKYLSLKLFGDTAVFLGETPLTLESSDLRNALIYLALEPLPVKLDELTKLLGVQRPDDFYKDLNAFADLTAALEVLANGRLRLHAIVDVLEFEYAVQDGYFKEALAIYQAQPECGFLKNLEPKTEAFQAWSSLEEAKLKLLFHDALRGRYETLAVSDDIDFAIIVAKQLLSHDPLDEYTHQRIMQLELFRGNLSGALEQYAACQSALAQLLGVAPLAETQELADIIDALSYDAYFSKGFDVSDE